MKYYIDLILPAVWETLIMVGISSILTIILGLLLGILLVVTRKGGIAENTLVHNIFGRIADAIRSVPFVILLLILIPGFRFIVGTSIGVKASILPLVFGATPFFGRLVESSLLEVKPGVIEAAASMGANNKQIIKIMLSEAMPSLVRAGTTLVINLIGYSAMAGVIGAGGLGDLAIRYGHHRYRMDVLWITVILLYLFVLLVQYVGTKWEQSLERN